MNPPRTRQQRQEEAAQTHRGEMVLPSARKERRDGAAPRVEDPIASTSPGASAAAVSRRAAAPARAAAKGSVIGGEEGPGAGRTGAAGAGAAPRLLRSGKAAGPAPTCGSASPGDRAGRAATRICKPERTPAGGEATAATRSAAPAPSADRKSVV